MSTQIYATFGPSCDSEEILKEMIQAGMSGMRLNLSHTTLPASKAYVHAYQRAARICGVEPQILIDMQGPELRVGAFEDFIELREGEFVFLQDRSLFKANHMQNQSRNQKSVKIPVPDKVISATEIGDKILLDDGKILLEVIASDNDEKILTELVKGVPVRVLRGGVLKSHKSIKIQDKNIKLPVLTEHDIQNIKIAKEYGVTALMQPFVLNGEDLKEVRNVLKKSQAEDIRIFAKIENRIGVENLENILPESDVIIIARGDLGNDMPLWELPKVQKQIEDKCKEYHKPYIVVTQMLSSMEEHPVPTRAEVSDIFHAVYHGAWGVMITGESAIGKYPVEAVKYLRNTAQEAEKYNSDMR